MSNDRWYKRLGWFLLFSCITLLIFFVLDYAFNAFTEKYTSTRFTAFYVEAEYKYKESDTIVLTLDTDATSFTVDLWIDEENTGLTFENEKTISFKLSELSIDLEPGTYTVKSSVFGKKGLSREREVLITTTLIIE
ncbi:MAG: hypothetical protein IKC22_02885 [Bacilli bacterium]|nr:hypothetical protein [Bacilli bacterium]